MFTNDVERVRISSVGNVGIGTTTPYAKLSVVGQIVGEYFTATSTTATSTFAGGLSVAGAAGLTVLQNGNIGIGTASPLRKFHLTNTGSNAQLLLEDSAASANQHYGSLGFSRGGFSFNTMSDALATTSRMYINSSGLVGVGTTSPYAKLSVWGSGIGTGSAFEIVNNASTTIAKFLDNGTGYFLGNIGIGTTTPYAKLAVVGEAVADYFTATSLTGTTTIAGSVNVGSGALTYDYSSGVTEIANLTLGAQSFESDAGLLSWTDMPVTSNSVFGTINSYSAQIDSTPILTVYSEAIGDGTTWNNAVGIGTTTPFAVLSVAGISTSTVSITARPLFDIASSSGSSFLRVSAAGNLGLGTTTPAWLAHLASAVAPQLALTDPNAAANQKHWTFRSLAGSLFFATSSDAYATSSMPALTINSNGYVGIATTSPWRTFSINGTVAMSGLTTSVTGNALCITTNKEVTDAGAASCVPSSERFKENIQTLAPSFALDDLSKLRVVSFDYKDGFYSSEDQKGSYGLIAEEVEKIDAKLVDYGYDGKPLTLKFEKFIGLFVQSIQELVARVTGLETKINTQQQEIDALKDRMNTLDGQTSAAQTPPPSEPPLSPEPTPEPEPIVEPEPIIVPEPAPVDPAPVDPVPTDPVPEPTVPAPVPAEGPVL